LHKIGCRRIRPKKIPVKRDEQKAEVFKQNFKILYENLEIWFFDETGIEGDSPLSLVWSLPGTRPKYYYSGSYIRESLLGAVNPKTGALETLIMPYVDKDIFQQFLDHFNMKLNDRYVMIVLENASWHKPISLNWGKIIPLYLPPYSPDLNPIEVLWKVIKDRLYNPTPTKNHDELQDRIQVVIRQLLDNPEEVKSICKVGYS
jgi:transposase